MTKALIKNLLVLFLVCLTLVGWIRIGISGGFQLEIFNSLNPVQFHQGPSRISEVKVLISKSEPIRRLIYPKIVFTQIQLEEEIERFPNRKVKRLENSNPFFNTYIFSFSFCDLSPGKFNPNLILSQCGFSNLLYLFYQVFRI